MELDQTLLKAVNQFIFDTCQLALASELSSVYAASTLDEFDNALGNIHTMLSTSVGNTTMLLNLYQAVQLKKFLMLYEIEPFSAAYLEPLDMILIVCGPKELILIIIESLEQHLEYAPLPLSYTPSFVDAKLKFPVPFTYSSISIEEFISEPNVPKVLEGLLDHWQALTKWSDPNHLLKVMGHRLIPVELGQSYLESNWTQKIMLMESFLRDYICNDTPNEIAYMAQYDLLAVIPSLQSDVDDLDFCHIDLPGSKGDVYRNVWVGMKNCYTPTHFDKYYNLFCQIVGRKHIRLFPPGIFDSAEIQGNNLLVNLDSILNEPRISSKVLEVILEPGEVLYIPKDWWHEVRSLSSYNISISHWF